jgi:phosphohistidine phosphatase
MLAGPGSAASALDRLNAKFPTAAIASLDVESDWAELGAASARLTDFITPRELG